MSATPDEIPNSSSRVVPPEVAARVFESALDADASESPGARIGPYKLLEEIGEGGFGVVWMAEQIEPIRRRVALKIIKSGMDTREVIARFEAERQALALMDHPNIARVLDAGATDAGRPFFVMELVRGVPITRYCDENRLPAEARLRLFMAACQAVQHAHQKGVIHRDLKPSNILVTLNDGTPVPKVIDFGIAKATGGTRLTEKTLFTRFHSFIGTPAYTSPEQMEMSSLDADTRSDIYSLGVLLYELLAGRPPFDADELLKSGIDAMRRTICEVDPPRPSIRLGTFTNEDRATIAQQRSTEPGKLSLLLRGDLDWIVMRCLEKDRARRYETANGLARDIERHLANETVTARPPSSAYRLRKFVRRHKAAVAATTAVVAALVAGLVTSSVLLVREREARAEAQAAQIRAQVEAARSAEVARFMKEMLAGIGPQVALGRDTQLLRAIVDGTALRVRRDLAGEPEVYADLLETLGLIYSAIGEHLTGEKLLRDALAVQEKLHSRESLPVARLLHETGLVLNRRSMPLHAEPLFHEALEIRERLLASESLDLAETRAQFGRQLLGRGSISEAEALFELAMATQRQALGDDHPDVARTLLLFASGLMGLPADPTKPEFFLREAIAIFRKSPGPPTSELIEAEFTLGYILGNHQKRWPEGEQVLRDALDKCRVALSDTHPMRAQVMFGLALALMAQDKLAEAELVSREGLALAHLNELGAYSSSNFAILFRSLLRQGKAAEAEQAVREAIEFARTQGDPFLIAIYLAHYTDFLLTASRYDEAEVTARESLALREKADTMGWLTLNSRRHLGEALIGQERFAEAEEELMNAHRGLLELQKRSPDRVRSYIGSTRTSLFRLYTRWNRPDEAGHWRDQSEEHAKGMDAEGLREQANNLRAAIAAIENDSPR